MVVIACETLKNELNLAMRLTGREYPVIWVESGLHEWPGKLRARLQEIIDSLDCETALMAFGFCGNSAVGVQATRAKLIIPRAADCITLFLGSRKKREEIGNTTYFFTEGYLLGERNIIKEYGRSIQRYGSETAEWLIREMTKNYERLAVIDTGAYETGGVMQQINSFAEAFNLSAETVPGDIGLLRELLLGPWPNEKFLTVEPGGSVTIEDSLNLEM